MICAICGKNNLPLVTICASCGSALGGATSNTGALDSGSAVAYSPALKSGSSLQNGAFKIGEVLGQGGFGITYKGGDMALKRYVAIKEFFPNGCARSVNTVQPTGALTLADYQNIKVKFLAEARTLAKFNHPGIVRVFGAFEENNTAYMVMELLDGESLQKRLETKGVMGEKEAVAIFVKVGEALAAIHAEKLIHRDIKPDNIMLTKDGRTVLIDFGTAREFATGKTKAMTAMLTHGYAPLEQYGSQARFGTYSDVYALGATLYHCLTGQLPPPATDRAAGVELQAPDQLNPNLSRAVSDAVVWALQVKANDRPQSIEVFLDALRSDGKRAPQTSMPGSTFPSQTIPGQTSVAPYSPPPMQPAQGVWVQQAGERQMLTNAPAEAALQALQQAFLKAGVANVQVDHRNFTVDGKTGLSVASYGQHVTAQVSTAPQGFMVQVDSRPVGQITDWGRGKTEVQTVLSHFETILKNMPGVVGATAPMQNTPTNAPNQWQQNAPIPSPYSTGGAHPYPSHRINDSGQGANAVLPMELRGYNGGAFFLSGLWGFFNGAPWASGSIWLISWIPGVQLISFLIALYMGSSGNELAWKGRRWESVEQFKEVQKIWQNWGVGIFFASLLIGFLIALGSN